MGVQVLLLGQGLLEGGRHVLRLQLTTKLKDREIDGLIGHRKIVRYIDNWKGKKYRNIVKKMKLTINYMDSY